MGPDASVPATLIRWPSVVPACGGIALRRGNLLLLGSNSEMQGERDARPRLGIRLDHHCSRVHSILISFHPHHHKHTINSINNAIQLITYIA